MAANWIDNEYQLDQLVHKVTESRGKGMVCTKMHQFAKDWFVL